MAQNPITVPHRNELLLVGELETAPAERTLAQGDEVVTFRLTVAPDADAGNGRDSLECTVVAPRAKRAALTWEPGDIVEVAGAVRRRFYRVGAASRPFTVVEVQRARRVSAAVTARRQRRG